MYKDREIIRKPRRTKKQLEEDLIDALARLVSKEGFTNIPLYMLTQEAGIDSNVFYRRYSSMYELYGKLARKYDFCINNLVDMSELYEMGDKEFYKHLMKKLYTELSSNVIMQKLLIWELSESNDITRHTSLIREKLNVNIIDHYAHLFQGSGVDIRHFTGLIIGGIYYITLHRKNFTHSILSFGSTLGEKQLFNIIDTFTNLIFDKLERHSKLRRQIEAMLADGIAPEAICRYLELNEHEYSFIMA